MLTVEEVRERLKDRRTTMIADATGLSKFTIIKIRDGRTPNPSYGTMALLSDYLEGKK